MKASPANTRSRTARWLQLLLLPLVLVATNLRATVLWHHSSPIFIRQTSMGVDLLQGAVKPQDTNSSSTLYFKFHVDALADSATKSIADYEAGMVFFEHGEEHLGMGDSHSAWAYSAINVPKSAKGYVDLNSATPERGFNWEYIRAGNPKTIVFKVEYVPGHDARVTTWLNPNLNLGAAELNQPTNIVTRFEACATFDEIHLVYRGGNGGGWKFSNLIVATSFEDMLEIHFWQREWFVGLAALSLLIGTILAILLWERRQAQFQIRRLERERLVATERARIARDIHDELGSSLTKICKLAELLERNAASSGNEPSFARAIAGTARNTIQTMDEIVWAVNPKNDTLKEMADYLVYFAEDFLRPTGILYRLDVPLKLPDISVTAEVRHNMFMVLKESLNNAVKHAAAREIQLRLTLTDNRLTLQIIDDGRGFDLAAAALGNGLENMRKRLDDIGGQLQVKSQPGHGTSVTAGVPVGSLKAMAHE